MKKTILLLATVLTLSNSSDFDNLTLECDAYRLAMKFKLDKAIEVGNVNLWDLAIDDLNDSDKFLQGLMTKCKLTESERKNLEKGGQEIQRVKLMAESELEKPKKINK